MRHIQQIGLGVIAGSLFSVAQIAPAVAQQSTLTNAEVYRLRNQVQLLLRNQPVRPARVSDRLQPLDSLRTAQNSIAELIFNEGSIARVDQNTTFRFQSGMRRFQLPNRIAMNETVFVLENGVALIISPPGSVGSQIQTPDSRINILPVNQTAAISPSVHLANAQPFLVAMRPDRNLGNLIAQSDPPSEDSPLLPPPDRSDAVMVVHDATRGTTQVFALTQGIVVGDRDGNSSVNLAGGQTVGVSSGRVGAVQEFDLEAFYRSVPLAAGLGPGQENSVAQESPSVQASLNAVRPETLAAVRAQARRTEGFGSNFLNDALGGGVDRDFNGQRGEPSFAILEPQVTPGTFVRTGENTGTFVDNNDNQTGLGFDFNDRTITINGDPGVANSVGLSGRTASGTVVFRNGRATQIRVFGVGEDEPQIDQPYRGTLTNGIAPDR